MIRSTGGHDQAVDVSWAGVLAVAFGACTVGYAGLQITRLPRVWRGDSLDTLPWSNNAGPEVNHRSFPAFTLFLVLFTAGVLLAAPASVWDVHGLGVTAVLCLFMSVPALVLWILVNATNRPRFLVPPARRDEPGWWAAWRQRRDRRGSGLPPTTHVVEVLDVRAPPEARHPDEPYFMAVCSADDCGWVSDPVGRDAEHPDPEGTVRELAADHSTEISGPRRPLG